MSGDFTPEQQHYVFCSLLHQINLPCSCSRPDAQVNVCLRCKLVREGRDTFPTEFARAAAAVAMKGKP